MNAMTMSRYAQARDYVREVVSLLTTYRSLPFLELAAVTGAADAELERAIADLEARKIVRVTEKGNPLEEIVTIRDISLHRVAG